MMTTHSGRMRAIRILQVSAVAALATLGCHRSPWADIPWLRDAHGAAWIVYPAPVDTRAHPSIEIEAVFRRSFDLDEPPAAARLRVRALRGVTITLNGRPVGVAPPAAAWPDEAVADAGPHLRRGANDLSIAVTNQSGPPALLAALELPDGTLVTDEEWEVSRAGAVRLPAARASRLRVGSRFDPDGSADWVLSSLLGLWPWLVALFAVGLGATIGIERFTEPGTAGDRSRALAIRALPLLPAVLLACLLLNNASHLPRGAGFDAEGHLDYVQRLQTDGSLPFADEGWQMYQPPLYYILASLLLRAGSWSVREISGIAAIRLFNLVLALCNLGLVLGSLRLAFPENRRAVAAGLIVAAFLPGLLVVLHYPTNEVLAITLSSAVFWAALRLLRMTEPRLRDHLLVGIVLGAALLAKFSVLLIIPGLAAALLWTLRDTAPPERIRRLAGIAAVLVTATLVCSWHYARTAARFGTPLVGNWDRSSGFAWWQDPGYRTSLDYLRFGRSLASPLFSGVAGVWDGFYSTLWGDGLLSGVIDLVTRPPWAYSLMAAGFVLAIVPTIGLLIGGTFACFRLARRPDSMTVLLAGSAVVTCGGLLFMTLRVPSYAQAKAFYGLVALVPFAALTALGLDHLAGYGRTRRRLVFASLGLWAIVSFATYWVPGSAARTQVTLGAGFITDGDPKRALESFQLALSKDPGSWNARLALANLLLSAGAPREIIENLLNPAADSPPLARRHLALSLLLLREGDTIGALREADQGVRVNPDLVDLHLLRGALLETGGDPEGAVSARREALRIDPFDVANHLALERLLASLGDTADSETHREYARRLGAPR